MRLKNKKTGEIGTLIVDGAYKFVTNFAVEDDERNRLGEYASLAELNEEWEDYEEPKDFWYIDDFMIVCGTEGEFTTPDLASFTKKDIEKLKEIGNYFESKEKAEKVVKKLKAWKRLKGEIVGWSFSYDLDLNGCGFNDEDIVVGIKLPRNASKKDLDLLFGGEE